MARIQASKLFLGICLEHYTNSKEFPELKGTINEVRRIAELLHRHGYETHIVEDPPAEQAKLAMSQHLGDGSLAPSGSLIVLWAGHGKPSPSGLHLITKNIERTGGIAQVTSDYLVESAVRTGASKILILLDTCFSGQAVLPALKLSDLVKAEQPDEGRGSWIGVVASAQNFQRARNGAFGKVLFKVLQEGPSDQILRNAWSPYNRTIRAADFLSAIQMEWEAEGMLDQELKPATAGNGTLELLPNPLFNAEASLLRIDEFVLSSRGADASDQGDFFSGRVSAMATLVHWLRSGQPGLYVVKGPAGTGKSALLGRIVALSNGKERKQIFQYGPLLHEDPGEGALSAQVAVRGLTKKQLVERIDAELVRNRILAPVSETRNWLELRGALEKLAQREKPPPVILLDGLDEAVDTASTLMDEVINPLTDLSLVLVGCRELSVRDFRGSCDEVLPPLQVLDLGSPELLEQTRVDLTLYARKRLVGIDSAMDPRKASEEVVQLAGRQSEGTFLLVRLITSELRLQPIDTSQPGWESQLASSVEVALQRDLIRLPPMTRGEQHLPQAAREMLEALAWAYGNGFPDDLWALAATALSPTGISYERADIFWLIRNAWQWIVCSGGNGRAYYKLAHQRLAEHLRSNQSRKYHELEGESMALRLATVFLKEAQAIIKWNQPLELTDLLSHLGLYCADAGNSGIDILRGASAANDGFLPILAIALSHLGQSYGKASQWQEALPYAQESVALSRDLQEKYQVFLTPQQNNANRLLLADSLMKLAHICAELERFEDALISSLNAVDIHRDLARNDFDILPALDRNLRQLSSLYGKLEMHEEALQAARSMFAIRWTRSRSNWDSRQSLSRGHFILGIRYIDFNNHAKGILHIRRSLAIGKAIAKDDPSMVPDLAEVLMSASYIYGDRLDLSSDALTLSHEASDIYRKLANENSSYLSNLVEALHYLGTCYLKLNLPRLALSPLHEACCLCREFPAEKDDTQVRLAGILLTLGACFGELKEPKEAFPLLEEALALSLDRAAFSLEHGSAVKYSPVENAYAHFYSLEICCSELARPEASQVAWDKTLNAMPTEVTKAELLLYRALNRDVDDINAVHDLYQASTLFSTWPVYLLESFNFVYETRRDLNPQLFDQAWQEMSH